MISQISGVLIGKAPPMLVLEVNGIAYEIEAPMSTIYDLPEVGQKVTLHTHLLVREDAHLLYGFNKSGEKTVFRQLLKVNGIGAKIALAILSALSMDELKSLVDAEDIARLTKVPGIGRKTAERLILELRDKLDLSIVSDEISKSKPASLFFLSKFGCLLEKFRFYSNITLDDMWNDVDILVTSNPNLLLNQPKGKTVIKFETQYNSNIKNNKRLEMIDDLNPKEFQNYLSNNDTVLVDVREKWELDLCKIEGAIHCPMSTIAESFSDLNPDDTIALYCHHGFVGLLFLEV